MKWVKKVFKLCVRIWIFKLYICAQDGQHKSRSKGLRQNVCTIIIYLHYKLGIRFQLKH